MNLPELTEEWFLDIYSKSPKEAVEILVKYVSKTVKNIDKDFGYIIEPVIDNNSLTATKYTIEDLIKIIINQIHTIFICEGNRRCKIRYENWYNRQDKFTQYIFNMTASNRKKLILEPLNNLCIREDISQLSSSSTSSTIPLFIKPFGTKPKFINEQQVYDLLNKSEYNLENLFTNTIKMIFSNPSYRNIRISPENYIQSWESQQNGWCNMDDEEAAETIREIVIERVIDHYDYDYDNEESTPLQQLINKYKKMNLFEYDLKNIITIIRTILVSNLNELS